MLLRSLLTIALLFLPGTAWCAVPDGAKALSPKAPTLIRSNDATRFYGATAALEGKVHYAAPHTKPAGSFWLVWQGDGTASWKISVSKTADYEVNLCYASRTAGAAIAVSAAEQKLTGAVRRTNGFFPDEIPAHMPMDFERVPLKGTLQLSKGESMVRLGIGQAAGATIRVRSLELVPVDAKARLRADSERARASRANTDWFVRAGYGVMFHCGSPAERAHHARLWLHLAAFQSG